MQTRTPELLVSRIDLPEPNTTKLSFCASAKPQHVQDWANLLHPTQVSQTGGQLYKALPEIVRLKTSAQTRFDILEIMRPYVQNTILSLNKLYIHQPTSLSNETQKAAILAQALQKHMVDGYLLVVRDLIAGKGEKTHSQLHIAMHRAMQGLGFLFLRCFQIYTRPPKGLWGAMHNLFQIADHVDLLDKPVTDDIIPGKRISTIQSVYFRTILMSAARPHQLNTQNVGKLFERLGDWATQVRFSIDLSDKSDNIYYVNLDLDEGPKYTSRMTESEQDQLKIELNLNTIVNQLATTNGCEPENTPTGNKQHASAAISPMMREHLTDCWTNIAQRNQERTNARMTVDICFGLSECHYFFNQSHDFDDFIDTNNQSDTPIDNPSNTFTPADSFGAQNKPPGKQALRVDVQNMSGNGYCLLCNSTASVKLVAGEVVGIREMGKRGWKIGVVRWIRQKKSANQLGILILSDQPQPAAIAQVFDIGGESDFVRAILLPPSQFSEVPSSLITPSVPFKEHDRVKLMHTGNIALSKLDACVFSTGAIQQFTYRTVEK